MENVKFKLIKNLKYIIINFFILINIHFILNSTTSFNSILFLNGVYQKNMPYFLIPLFLIVNFLYIFIIQKLILNDLYILRYSISTRINYKSWCNRGIVFGTLVNIAIIVFTIIINKHFSYQNILISLAYKEFIFLSIMIGNIILGKYSTLFIAILVIIPITINSCYNLYFLIIAIIFLYYLFNKRRNYENTNKKFYKKNQK